MSRFPTLAPAAPLLVVALVTMASATSPPAVAADGVLDPAWGGDGISEGFGNSIPRSAAAATDGHVYFTGQTTLPDASEFEYWRNDDSGGGIWYGCSMSAAFLDDFDIRKVLFDEDGKMLFAGTMTVFGTETVERAFLARLTGAPACAFDATFSGAGWEYFDDAPYCDTEDCRLVDLAVTNDATTRYVALLESVQNALVSDYYLVGLTATGALDPNFGSGGLEEVTAPGLGLLAGGGARLVVDPADRVYALLSFYDPDASFDLDTALLRFLSNGALDATFADSGAAVIATDDAVDSAPRALAIGQDGKLGLAYYEVDTTTSRVLAMQVETGQSTSLGIADREPRALTFDGLGRLLVAYDNSFGDGLRADRYEVHLATTGLTVDPAFTPLVLDVDAGGNTAERPVDLVTPSGRPMILVEAAQIGGGTQAVLVRLQNSLIFADGFAWGSTRFWN